MLATYAYRNVIKLEGSGRFPLDHWRIVIIRGTIPSTPVFTWRRRERSERVHRGGRGGSKTMRRRQIGLRARNKLAQLSPNSRGSSANVARLPEELETLPFFPADAQNFQNEERKDMRKKERERELELRKTDKCLSDLFLVLNTILTELDDATRKELKYALFEP